MAGSVIIQVAYEFPPPGVTPDSLNQFIHHDKALQFDAADPPEFILVITLDSLWMSLSITNTQRARRS